MLATGAEVIVMGRPQDVWIGQCAAARGIRNQQGIVSALDYLIGEKLMTYAEIAAVRSDFARELPRFVAEVRAIFSKEEIAAYLEFFERVLADGEQVAAEMAAGVESENDLVDRPEAWAEQQRLLVGLKELLTAEQLGTS